MSTTLIAVISVLTLAVVAFFWFILAMCRIGASADVHTEKVFYMDKLRQDMQDEAVHLAALPQGMPTDDMLNNMAIEQEARTSTVAVHVNPWYNAVVHAVCQTCEYQSVCEDKRLDLACNKVFEDEDKCERVQ